MSSKAASSSSVIFTLDAASKTDTPISTSSPSTTSSYRIPTSLTSGLSPLTLFRVPPFPQPPSTEPVFTLYKTDLITSPKVHATINETTVKRSRSAMVETVPGGKQLLDISYHSGIISECSEAQRAVARMFEYRTADGGELQALEVYDAKDMHKSRLELVIAAWVYVVWLKVRPKMSIVSILGRFGAR